MNRKARRAARNATAAAVTDWSAQTDDLISQAGGLFHQGQFAPARDICTRVLAREPANAAAHNLMGAIFQTTGRDKLAVEQFAKALASDESNALLHYNIALSYQRLNLRKDAVEHFTRAIALRMDGQSIEALLTHSPAIVSCLNRIAQQWPRRLTIEGLFGETGVASVAGDVFLQCALETTAICDPQLESFLSSVRFAILQQATEANSSSDDTDEKALGFYATLAQQCFINEYVFAQSDDETRKAEDLRLLLEENLSSDGAVPPLLLIAVAMYFPLHELQSAATLHDRSWPPVLLRLLQQQLIEPLEEMQLRSAIPSLTEVNDDVSIRVKQQYEENPYPRWSVIPDVSIIGDWRTRFPPRLPGSGYSGPLEILIAGCGTGQNSIQAALKFPTARVLAVDLSVPSLTYALRKTREANIQNIKYAQADVLQLEGFGRSFDRIGAIGVLHHLADPRAGWRVLLSLLRRGGVMDIGLYSETARRAVVAARALIKDRGYCGTAADIRRFREEIRRTAPNFAKDILASPDFYTTSGCRDLLFHVMEHRFNIPEISNFLQENALTFLGFRLAQDVSDRFRDQFPRPEAATDLDRWHDFEMANPQTFAGMYRFAVRKTR